MPGSVAYMTFSGVARSSIKRFQSCLVWAISLSDSIKVIASRLSIYWILLSRSWLKEMRLASQSDAYAISHSSIDVLSTNDMTMFLILLTLSTCPLAVVKSRDLGCNLVVNRFLLFVRYWEVQESRYQTLLRACINFLTMLATPGQKSSVSKLSLSVTVM